VASRWQIGDDASPRIALINLNMCNVSFF